MGSAAALLILGDRLSSAQIMGGLGIAAAVLLIQIADVRTAGREAVLPPAPD